MKKTKRRTKYLLLLLILFISVGYAILQSNLSIIGTTSIQDSKWDIHWNNVVITTGSVSTSNADKATIDNTKTTVNYNIVLDKPGDFYEFTVDAVNAGTIDGMIDVISSKLNNVEITTLPAYLNYSITYSDGVPLQGNQLLAANSSETYKVRIEYKRDIEANQLPETTQTLNLSFTVIYKQADGNAIEIEHISTVYTNNNWYDEYGFDSPVWIGQAITPNITVYNTAAEAMQATNRQFYFKHILIGGIVKESYICFEKNSNTYCLRGSDILEYNSSNCKTEYDDGHGECMSPYYEDNKGILQRAFQESECRQSGDSFICNDGFLSASTGIKGYPSVSTSVGNFRDYCVIYGDGDSVCNG